MTHLTVIVDADTPLQRVGFLDLPNVEAYIEAHRSNLKHIINQARSKMNATSKVDFSSYVVELHYTGNERPRYRNNFDNQEVYKIARDTPPASGKKHSPKFLQEMLEDIITDPLDNATISLCDASKMEADDTVSISAADKFKYGDDFVIVGIDKDLKQIPGFHFNYVKELFEHISSETAKQFLYYQLLEGDVSDSVGGLDGVGPKKAKKFLGPLTSPEEMLLEVFFRYLEWYNGGMSSPPRSKKIHLNSRATWNLLKERANKLYLMQNYMRENWEPPIPYPDLSAVIPELLHEIDRNNGKD